MDSRTTAAVNRDELRLTPSKRYSFQSVARSVVETTVSLLSCQQARRTSWALTDRVLHEVLPRHQISVVPASAESWIAVQALTDESVSDEAPYFTGLTVTREPAWNEGDSTDAVNTKQKALHTHRHARSERVQSPQPSPHQVVFASPE